VRSGHGGPLEPCGCSAALQRRAPHGPQARSPLTPVAPGVGPSGQLRWRPPLLACQGRAGDRLAGMRRGRGLRGRWAGKRRGRGLRGRWAGKRRGRGLRGRWAGKRRGRGLRGRWAGKRRGRGLRGRWAGKRRGRGLRGRWAGKGEGERCRAMGRGAGAREGGWLLLSLWVGAGSWEMEHFAWQLEWQGRSLIAGEAEDLAVALSS